MMITNNKSAACRPNLVLLLSLFLLAAFAQAQAPPPPPPAGAPPPPAGGPPIHHVYWDIRTETFQVLRTKLMRLVLDYANRNPPYNPPSVNQIPVTGPRRRGFYDPPPEWIYIHIKVGEAPEEQVTLAMAIDDLYIIGFCNGDNVWYQFSGDKDVFKGLPPGTHILPIEENYRDLISGGRVNMPLVPLGKNSATHATLQLATYNHIISPKEQAKDGLVRFVIMIGEGMRLQKIDETFSGDNWEETFLTTDDALSVVDWGSSSRLVIRWFLTGGAKWGGGCTWRVWDCSAPRFF
ncbi:ribosome-inactivating protein 3-like [Miscanthus floridulus]|uniref:ribosome-inactivating protein 3-like n=1 Tax=Miscanthus floridulus TaxID=154761 RepID=UPI003458D9CB